MPTIEFPFPLLGKSANRAYERQPPLTTSYLNNVRPYDVDETRGRGGQRPGLGKLFTQRIGGASANIDALVQVSLSDTVGDTPYETRLIAIANNEIWYTNSAGTMVELAAANGDIASGVPMVIIPAFQKVYFADGSRFRVLDFINTRLTTIDIAPAGKRAPLRDEILVGQTSGAEMIVDYISASDGFAYCFGYQTTGTDFSAGEVVQVEAGADVQFTSVIGPFSPDPPHYYTWTVYPTIVDGETTYEYGTMPDNANRGCLYRGRIVLTGNTDKPNQWYMTRQGNPWDFQYTTNDAQSAVAGGNAEAGECPGIVTATVPYSDDYMIMGADHEVWMMRGDPAAGGVIDNLTSEDGIFGPKSWCFDGFGNLYFAGTAGIYRVPISDRLGIGKPTNISNVRLPEMFSGISRSTHRVLLAYDPVREGINIFITRISNGDGNHYWYDIRTEMLDQNKVGGFFPESYLAGMGPYSVCFYDADLKSKAKIALGCNDGYIRHFADDRAYDLWSTDVKAAINSYVLLGPANLTGSR